MNAFADIGGYFTALLLVLTLCLVFCLVFLVCIRKIVRWTRKLRILRKKKVLPVGTGINIGGAGGEKVSKHGAAKDSGYDMERGEKDVTCTLINI
jgi:hypothetical protein